MASAIFRYEGNLDTFIGDCVMATWGPPLVHADNPQRALRCALEMLEVIRPLNAERAAQGKKPISVGIGVNTGPAVVGYIGSKDRHEFTAIGDSINTASRLCDKAAGGDVLASEATVRRAGPMFKVEAVAPMQVKGKAQGVSAFRVLGINPH
jgi:adenylate cyclase